MGMATQAFGACYRVRNSSPARAKTPSEIANDLHRLVYRLENQINDMKRPGAQSRLVTLVKLQNILSGFEGVSIDLHQQIGIQQLGREEMSLEVMKMVKQD